jgi:CRISPR-associated endonuclease Cas1
LILGHTGGIILDALAWCHDVGISVTQLDPVTGRILTAVGAAGRDDPRLRRAQALAATTAVGVELARTLIGAKISGQANVLLTFDEDRAATTLDRHATTVDAATSLKAVTEAEAKAANTYFAAWARHVTIRFATRDRARVPEHWYGYDGRRSVLDYGRSPRKAATPVNALLNYCYALAEAECRIALVAVGLDPGLGIIHADELGRDSLALNIIEPVRPLVDTTVLGLVRDRPFRAADFHETPSGGCRILAPLTHELAEAARGWTRDVHAVAERVANTLAHNASAPIRLSTPLTGANRRAAGPTLSRVERRPRKQAPKAAPSARRCRDCGAELAETARKLCPACWPVSRARQAQERAAAGTAALAAQRAQGHDPTNTAPAAAKRHESLISERAQRAEWESQNPNASRDPARYLADVAARLPSAPLSQIVKATGVSISAASRIRNGALMPHPRHWDALRRLADSQ